MGEALRLVLGHDLLLWRAYLRLRETRTEELLGLGQLLLLEMDLLVLGEHLLLLLRVEGVAGRGKGGRVLLLERRERHGRLAHHLYASGLGRHSTSLGCDVSGISLCQRRDERTACRRPTVLRRPGVSWPAPAHQDKTSREREDVVGVFKPCNSFSRDASHGRLW